jgi:hypothetical protein
MSEVALLAVLILAAAILYSYHKGAALPSARRRLIGSGMLLYSAISY